MSVQSCTCRYKHYIYIHIVFVLVSKSISFVIQVPSTLLIFVFKFYFPSWTWFWFYSTYSHCSYTHQLEQNVSGREQVQDVLFLYILKDLTILVGIRFVVNYIIYIYMYLFHLLSEKNLCDMLIFLTCVDFILFLWSIYKSNLNWYFLRYASAYLQIL